LNNHVNIANAAHIGLSIQGYIRFNKYSYYYRTCLKVGGEKITLEDGKFCYFQYGNET